MYSPLPVSRLSWHFLDCAQSYLCPFFKIHFFFVKFFVFCFVFFNIPNWNVHIASQTTKQITILVAFFIIFFFFSFVSFKWMSFVHFITKPNDDDVKITNCLNINFSRVPFSLFVWHFFTLQGWAQNFFVGSKQQRMLQINFLESEIEFIFIFFSAVLCNSRDHFIFNILSEN